jgi:hypothetical protein
MGIYYINRLIALGPKSAVGAETPGTPNRPISTAGNEGKRVLDGL